MKIKTKTDKFGVTTITCKGKQKETFDSFAASGFSLGNEWFLPFKYEVKKKTTQLVFSVNNLRPLNEFLRYALLREQFADFLMSISNFLTYSREHSVQNDYVVFDTKYVLIDTENMQLKFVYLPFKTPEDPPKSLYDFLTVVGGKLRLANASQDAHLLQRYRDFFVLRELFSVTDFKDMVDSIYNETYHCAPAPELVAPKTADLNMDCYEVLSGKEDAFAQRSVVVEEAVAAAEGAEVADAGAQAAAAGNVAGAGATSSAPTATLTRKANGQVYECNAFPCVVGSSPNANISIKGGAAISRTHAQIDAVAGGFTITDLGSTNGTYLKNKKLAVREPAAIQRGDTFRLANEFFVFNAPRS